MEPLQSLVDEIVTWASETFGDRQQTAIPVMNHLIREIEELKESLLMDEYYKGASIPIKEGYTEEFADCFILLFELANTKKLTVKDIIEAMRRKLEKNRTRKWGKMNADGSIEHVDDDEISVT